MKYVEVGGARMSAIGLGTWQFGSREWGYGHEYAEGEARGHRRSGPSTSGSPSSTRPRPTPSADPNGSSGRPSAAGGTRPSWPPRSSPSSPSARSCCSGPGAALRRLGVKTIDLYQIHQPNPVVPLSSTMPAFGQLLDEGSVGHAGVSNYSLARWQAAERPSAGRCCRTRCPSTSSTAGPSRSCCRGPRPTTGSIIAYSPLAQGLLSGRYDADHRPVGDGPDQLAGLPPREPAAGADR